MNKRYRGLAACFLIIAADTFLLPAITFAKTSEEPGPEFNSGQWIWALLCLVLVVVLAYWATRFLAGKFGVSQAKHLKVAESLFLGPNRHLYLLLVNKKVLLIGASEHGIHLLHDFSDPDFYTELEQHAGNQQLLPAGKFPDLIGTVLGGLHPRKVSDTDSFDTKQRLMEGLEKIRSWKTRGKNQ